jgi:hypothetical protein
MGFFVKTTGLTAAQALLEGFSERRLNAATATALTRAAVAAKEAARREMSSSFDRPTSWTLGGVYVRMATANRLEAEVGLADYTWTKSGTPAFRYLGPEVRGGSRSVKRFEQALQAFGAMPQGWFSVPGAGAKLDSFGNVSRGQIIQILSQVAGEITAGYSRTLPAVRLGMRDKAVTRLKNKRRRAFGRAGGQYVALPTGRGKLKPGIYMARGRDFGAKLGYGRTGQLVPVLLFVRSVSYRPRYDFYGTVERVANAALGQELGRAIEDQAARLAAKHRGQP